MQKSFTALILLISLAVTGVGCGGFTCKDAERGRELDERSRYRYCKWK